MNKLITLIFSFTTLTLAQTAQPIWILPNLSPVTGTSVSISAGFAVSPPNGIFDLYITNLANTIVDVVSNGKFKSISQAIEQTGSGAIASWNVPSQFPSGTYRIRLDISNTTATLNGQYFSPSNIVVSPYVPQSKCAVNPFVPQGQTNFSMVEVTSPEGADVDYNFNGWPQPKLKKKNDLAIPDSSKRGADQIPTGTVVHTSVVPATVSATTLLLSIPTVSAVEKLYGPAVVRVSYLLSGTAFLFAYSDTFYVGLNCSELLQRTTTTAAPTSTKSSRVTITIPTIKATISGISIPTSVPEIGFSTSFFVGILVGSILGTMAITIAIVLLIVRFWLKRRKPAEIVKIDEEVTGARA
ncbi:hypothetical protein HK096_010541 [Nowakowskiella sp. JEL0078]|nr:hypothetical protein HK096_010541 [Nowakowskiella sp. JEL0078]